MQNVGKHGLELRGHGRRGIIQPVDVGLVQPHRNIPVPPVVGQTQNVIDVAVSQKNSHGGQPVLLQSLCKSIRVSETGVEKHAFAACVRGGGIAVDA